MIKIPEEEIRYRFQKLRNYENVLYPNTKAQKEKLRQENKALKKRVKELEEENKQIEKLQLQLEELRAMKFGRKREKNKDLEKLLPVTMKRKNKKRKPESYRRSEPKQEEVTDRLRMKIKTCPECGEELKSKKEHTHYREDLYEVEELLKSAKKIVETIVESGKCPKCKKCVSAMEIPKQKVIIGQNIRMMIVYYIVIQGQSYEEARRGLLHQYGVDLSKGEIANILQGESYLLTSYYNYLVDELSQESKEIGAHYDETSWKTGSQGQEISEGNYCWIKIGIKSQKRLIWFGKSRGKGVAELLRGEKENSIGISDDYPAYYNLFEVHGLCWAHPHRKLRDLACSNKLSKKNKKICQKAYKDFSNVYKKAEKMRQKLLANAWDENQKKEKKKELEELFDKLIPSINNEPEKLQTIRESLKKKKGKYFTFFDFPLLPLDNNKAERAIRKIVIKRKKSLGSVSQKGANTLTILYSVLFSLTESNPDKNFWEIYKMAMEFEGQ